MKEKEKGKKKEWRERGRREIPDQDLNPGFSLFKTCAFTVGLWFLPVNFNKFT